VFDFIESESCKSSFLRWHAENLGNTMDGK